MVISQGKELLELQSYGIKNVGDVFKNLPTPALYEEIVRRKEGLIAHHGPMVVGTGHHTGRSPEDKFIVKEESSQEKIWWGKENRPFEPVKFDYLYHRLLAYLQGKDIFIRDCYAGAALHHSIPIRIVTEYAWHNLFARNMFIPIQDQSKVSSFKPEFTVFSMPRFHASPDIDGTKSEAFILVNFKEKLILIGGTSYAGEIKKAIFTVLNYLFPQDKVLSMHCSANVDMNNDVALFFGLSGTGKTSLSTDVKRKLIGDDEHGWSEEGIFNFEGGCYAKVIRISQEQEPQIYDCAHRFETILENVIIDSRTRQLDLDDDTLTENTRASYPITHVENSVLSGLGTHPSNIFMLSCDAFGIMPPIALLTPEQAAYYFLQGYTAKVAGTEMGLGNEPKAVFSPCFGAPFLALPPMKYAELLLDKITRHKVKCWMVNTGWVCGGFGKGERISIKYTRSLIRSAMKGDLDKATMEKDKVFGFLVPTACEDVPGEILKPAVSWGDENLYYNKARALAGQFVENFKQFADMVPQGVLKAGPEIGK